MHPFPHKTIAGVLATRSFPTLSLAYCRDNTPLAETYCAWVGNQLDSQEGATVGAAIIEPVLQVFPLIFLLCRCSTN